MRVRLCLSLSGLMDECLQRGEALRGCACASVSLSGLMDECLQRGEALQGCACAVAVLEDVGAGRATHI